MDEAQKKIIGILKDRMDDITIMQISKEAGIDRHTAAKHLEVLESKGLVEYRNIGKSKVWKISQDRFMKALKQDDGIINDFKNILNNLEEHVSIQNKDFHVIWNNKGMPSSICHEAYASNDARCKNCPVEKTFRTGKEESKIVKWKRKKMQIRSQPIKDQYNKTIAVVEIVKPYKKAK